MKMWYLRGLTKYILLIDFGFIVVWTLITELALPTLQRSWFLPWPWCAAQVNPRFPGNSYVLYLTKWIALGQVFIHSLLIIVAPGTWSPIIFWWTARQIHLKLLILDWHELSLCPSRNILTRYQSLCDTCKACLAMLIIVLKRTFTPGLLLLVLLRTTQHGL